MNITNQLRTLFVLTCIAAPALASGTISGKVDATPAKYLAETIVYVVQAEGTFKPASHTMDQKGMTFLPHLLIVNVGDTVKFVNNDGVDHNVYTPDHEGYNLGMFSKGQSREVTFKNAGAYTQLCSAHPEMLAFIFVGQNPYAAVVDKDGKYEIKGVPPGNYSVAIWNSKLKGQPVAVAVSEGKNAEANFSVKR